MSEDVEEMEKRPQVIAIREVHRKLREGQSTPRQAYDELIAIGQSSLMARVAVWEALGGRNAIYTEEDQENNQRVDELTKDLPKQ